MIDGQWHRQRLRLLTHQALSGLDAQAELQFRVDAVHAFVVPAKVLYVAQIQVAQAKSPLAMIVGQPDQPVRDERILGVMLGLIAAAGLAD